jgi:hypothetical protein
VKVKGERTRRKLKLKEIAGKLREKRVWGRNLIVIEGGNEGNGEQDSMCTANKIRFMYSQK